MKALGLHFEAGQGIARDMMYARAERQHGVELHRDFVDYFRIRSITQFHSFIQGMPKLQIACNTPVTDGMVVRTQCDSVRRAREGVMELLLVNHPLDCPICDQAGECKLQDYAFEYGVTQSRTREPRRALEKNVPLGPTIVFDQERCILCRRCVRFCREITGTGELAVLNRGDRSVIETFPAPRSRTTTR